MKGKRKRSSLSLRDILSRIRRFLMPWIEPTEPEDPYAYSMARLRRPPGKGGAAAAAIAELDEEDWEERPRPRYPASRL